MLMASCGQKHKAESTVEQFIEQYALNPSDLNDRDFENFDSTNVIGDSLLRAMQQSRKPLFRHPITYPTATTGKGKLFLLRMRFVAHDDTLWHTFYLDQQLEHVVAFK